METKLISFKRVVKREKPVKRIGLDADFLVAILGKEKDFDIFKPKIFNRNNVIFICQKVFAQALAVLTYKKQYSFDESKSKIFSFIKNYNINIIKNKEIGFGRINSLVNELKEKRKHIKAAPDDSDLEIIAIYKLSDIDCISTINSYHFEELCSYLNIDVEKPIEDVNIMWNQVFKKKEGFKKKKP